MPSSLRTLGPGLLPEGLGVGLQAGQQSGEGVVGGRVGFVRLNCAASVQVNWRGEPSRNWT